MTAKRPKERFEIEELLGCIQQDHGTEEVIDRPTGAEHAQLAGGNMTAAFVRYAALGCSIDGGGLRPL